MTAPSTFELYKALAEERPAKARRYRLSIQDSLEGTVGDLERARLEEALAGIAAGFAKHPVCDRCGRHLTDPESIARGIGPECARVAVSA